VRIYLLIVTLVFFFFRGKKPDAAIRDVKKFAEKKGYRWQENPDNPELAYDLMVFKTGYAFRLNVRAQRYHIRPDAFLRRTAGRQSP
jgi:hypothetical protein